MASNITTIPTYQTAIIDKNLPDTISREWYRYLYNLLVRIDSLSEELTTLRQEFDEYVASHP